MKIKIQEAVNVFVRKKNHDGFVAFSHFLSYERLSIQLYTPQRLFHEENRLFLQNYFRLMSSLK